MYLILYKKKNFNFKKTFELIIHNNENVCVN